MGAAINAPFVPAEYFDRPFGKLESAAELQAERRFNDCSVQRSYLRIVAALRLVPTIDGGLQVVPFHGRIQARRHGQLLRSLCSSQTGLATTLRLQPREQKPQVC